MTQNSNMHPRNPYKKPPNFNTLALEFPEFLRICSVNLGGRCKIDFKNENAVRVLTKCLLKKDFQLDVDLPASKLVPTLPLRFNYILFIEDIVKTFQFEQVTGIDIGCGASCIYPLLAVKAMKWKMFGLELDADSYRSAKENVSKNGLEDKIVVVQQKDEKKIFETLFEQNPELQEVHFCMCNPPFFGSSDQTDYNTKKNRTGHRDPPRGAKTGDKGETVTEGGEVEFIRKIIDESAQLKDRIKIYTTMFGHKNTLAPIKNFFRDHQITNYITTEFCQGHTTRWGVAWSFCEDLYLARVPQLIKQSGKRKGTHTVCYNFHPEMTQEEIDRALRAIFAELKLDAKILEAGEERVWEVKAAENTWSHARRKRREEMRQSGGSETSPVKLQKEEMEEEQEEEIPEKKAKIDGPYLAVNMSLRTVNKEVVLEIKYLAGIAGKDGANQLLQYIKNHYGRFFE